MLFECVGIWLEGVRFLCDLRICKYLKFDIFMGNKNVQLFLCEVRKSIISEHDPYAGKNTFLIVLAYFIYYG